MRQAAITVLLTALLLGCAGSVPPAPSVREAAAGTAPAAPATAAASGVGTLITSSPAAVPSSPTSGTPEGTAARGPARVTIGVLGSTPDLPLYLAEEKGYFARLGIDPVFERFDAGARMVASLATNQIDVGAGGPSVALYNALGRGVQVKIVADRVSGRDGFSTWTLVVRKELVDSGGLRDYADLRGRRVGLAARGVTGEIVLARALERGGLTLDDVDLSELPYPEMTVALGSGVLDVSVTIEPFATIAVERGGGVRWRDGQELVPNQVASIVMYPAAFVAQRPDVARDFMVAYLLGARDYNDAFVKKQPEALAQAQEVLVRRTDARDPGLVLRAPVPYMNPNGAFDRAALIADYEWFRQHSGLTEPVDFDRVIDESYVQHAIGVLGAYR